MSLPRETLLLAAGFSWLAFAAYPCVGCEPPATSTTSHQTRRWRLGAYLNPPHLVFQMHLHRGPHRMGIGTEANSHTQST